MSPTQLQVESCTKAETGRGTNIAQGKGTHSTPVTGVDYTSNHAESWWSTQNSFVLSIPHNVYTSIYTEILHTEQSSSCSKVAVILNFKEDHYGSADPKRLLDPDQTTKVMNGWKR